MKKICEYCGKEFIAKRKSQRYCSVKCSNSKRNSKISVQCSNCGKTFEIYKSTMKNSDGTIKKNFYCCQECKAEHQKTLLCGNNNPRWNSEEVQCEQCGKIIHRKKSKINNNKHHFCSQECKSKWQQENLCGENKPLYDPTISQEDREKGRIIEGYNEWRREVYERDNYTCQCCGDNKGGNLNAHHKDGYNWCEERRTDVNNGVTLCDKCHNEFHDIYGYGNNTEEQWNEFIEDRNKEAS